MIARENIETAYCLIHQKQRIYQYSTLDWQRDDIEYAIASYLDTMEPELLELLSKGKSDFLRNHASFGEEMVEAVETLEKML